MSHHFFMIVASYVRHINIHIQLKFQPFITKMAVLVEKLKIPIIEKVTMTSKFHDESTFSSEVRA